MSIFISTGEISGDLHAAKLSAALHDVLPQEEIWGMAGELALGMKREWDNDALHIMGLDRIVSSLPKLFKLRRQLAEAVVERKPRAVIVIDSPDFHIPLLSKIRSLGYRGPAIYVAPPTIWAWRSGRAKYLRRYCNMCLPLFSFEEKVLKQHGVKSFWCGHPMIDDFHDFAPSEVMPEDPLRVALLPGSRHSELVTLMPVLEETAIQLKEMGFHPVFSVAPGLDGPCRAMVLNNSSGIETTEVSGRNLMCQSRFVVGASGTASVEAMLLDKFMIVLYKGTPLEWRIYTALTHTKFVTIANVMAGREIYPELLQDKAKVENVMHYVQKYLQEPEYREDVHHQLQLDRDMMGEPGAVGRWAEVIKGMVEA